MATKEKLPSGFARRPSGSLRVQIRLKGHADVVKTFPLVGTGAAERKLQMVDAEAWATETRRRLLAGAHVSSREAERTSLAQALRRYEAEGMTGEEENQKVDRYRIGIILNDPIAERPVAFLNDKDVAAFRDRLLRQAMNRAIETADIEPVIDEVLPMEAAADAFKLMDRAGHFGKVVLKVG